MEGDFFSAFPGFQPNPSAPVTNEFARLAQHMKWDSRSKVYRREWAKFTAFEFSLRFGADSKLQNWQALCSELELGTAFTTITQCRKALDRVHVNLVDLIDSRRSGTPVHKFPSVQALRRYTRESGKVFPKAAAKKDGFLKDLLRKIW